MAQNLNRVTIQGNLTKDPELRSVGSGDKQVSVCDVRLAVNDRVKQKGEWTDVAYYFDVTVWGKQAENLHKYLGKGSGVIIDGKLRWHEWKAEDGSGRQHVNINAENVFFMPKSGGGGGGSASSEGGGFRAPAADDDDIPF